MKLGLINTYSTRNLGDAAIYAALAKLAPERRVHTDLIESYPTVIHGVQRDHSLRDCDAFVSVGGDIFNNARPRLVTRRFLQLLREVFRHGERAFVFGQSIPPSCRGLSLRMLTRVFRRIGAVMVRDVQSYKLLTQRGVRAQLSYDTAFVLRQNTDALGAAYEMLDRHGLAPDRTALISLRGGSGMYSLNEAECDRDLLAIASQLSARGHQPAFLVQADCDGADNDKTQALRLSRMIGGLPILDPFAVKPPLSPCDVLIALLGVANIVVGVRYHSAILRLISGRTPFVLYYSNKGRDLSERLKLPGCKLTTGVGSDLIGAIERSAEMDFDPSPISRDVAENFLNCIRQVA